MSTALAGPPDPIRDGDRLDPEIFQLPAERMKAGYYSDKYFVRARDVLIADGHDPVVTIQVFQMELVVIGVARDVCVTQAVDGMQERGYRVTAVRDATWGLGLEDEEVTLGRWASLGSVVTLSELTGRPRRL